MSGCPSTSHRLPPQQHSALIRPLEVRKVLDEASCLVEDDTSPLSPPPALEHTRTRTLSALPTLRDTGSAWYNRKPSPPHLSPLPKPSSISTDAPESPNAPISSMYHCLPMCGDSEHSVGSPSIVSDGPSTARGSSSLLDMPPPTSMLKRFRRELGYGVRAIASTSAPLTSDHMPKPKVSAKRTSCLPTTSSLISSDEGIVMLQPVASTAAHARTGSSSARPHKTKTKYKRVHRTGSSLPIVPLVYAQLVSEDEDEDGGDTAFVRPRRRIVDGSNMGGSDAGMAVRRGKQEGKVWRAAEAVGEMAKTARIMM